ncbi:hypothetical protein BGZ83_011975 [Gryganskiella cystojenkinii]|nr:hypothetical protein BGZ83_011975 [Gryganskiella cystojenkinii]
MCETMFSHQRLRRKCIVTMGGLTAVNVAVWILAGIVAKKYPELLGSMVVAYTLGLRHAVDADHLAAIDNVTRKLIYQGSLRSRIAHETQEEGGKPHSQEEQRRDQEQHQVQVQKQEVDSSWTPPVCVGLFFSLGHSTIVIIASIALAATATAIKDKFAAFGDTGGIIGTSVSASFLFLIGFINLIVLIQVGQELRRVKKTGKYYYSDPVKELIDETTKTKTKNTTTTSAAFADSDAITEMDVADKKHEEALNMTEKDQKTDYKSDAGDLEAQEAEKERQHERRFQTGGLFARIFRPLFNLIDRTWKMYPLGVLFGLGFDTATEVGLLGIAATNAQAGFPTAVILIFPALFTAGMSLIDTLDGIIMVNAYGWAFVNPIKKLWYNFVVTLMGVIVAFVVGFAELMGLLSEKLDLQGPWWDFFGMLSDNFGIIGYVILGAFILTWLFAVLYYRYGPMKELENTVVIIKT